MNCDPISRWYLWLEWAAFGPALQQRRLAFLKVTAGATSVLILGDGDGRYLRALLTRAPQVRADVVEMSAAMVSLAQSRASKAGAKRVRFYCADALSFPLGSAAYDLIVTHFFLDCFSEEELGGLVARVGAACKPGAQWVVSEFSEPVGRLAGWRARVWIRFLYVCFGWTTGLRVRQLPDYKGALANAGFCLEREESASWGLLTSQLWRKSSVDQENPRS